MEKISTQEGREKIAWLVLRIGVAFCFLYAGIGGFVNPQAWIGWFPKFMKDIIPGLLLLKMWGVYEIITALWILSGKYIFIPSLFATFSLAGLLVFNLGSMDVLFRDVTILFATATLAIQSFPPKLLEYVTKNPAN
ncbi:MAG: hypothetical protein V4467_02360 [Patescibacteria group bacterium]